MRVLVRITSTLALACLLGLAARVDVALATPAGRITGKVTDRDTGEALPGANVRLAGTSTGAATDENGRYTIVGAPSGTQNLVATYIGYTSQESQLTIPHGGSVQADFAPEWSSVEGMEIIVTAQVATLLEGTQFAGQHQVNFDGTRLASGVYFYRLETAVGQQVRHMVLLK